MAHRSRCGGILALAWLIMAASTHASAQEVHPAHMQETARVTELRLSGIMAGGQDLRVLLHARAGRFYAGYCLVEGMPEVPYEVAVEPPGTHRLVDAAGAEIAMPKPLFARYGYKNPEYVAIRSRYEKGEVRMDRLPDPPALRWTEQGGFAGTIDLLVPADGQGQNDALPQFSLRVTVAADGDGKTAAGTCTAWWWDWDDLSQGAQSPRRNGTAAVRLVPDHWQPKPGSGFAPGRDWPQTHGPRLDMSAIDCGVPLVEDLADARLLWVAEDQPGGAKGAIHKAEFGAGSLHANDMQHGAYAAPIVAGGKVYMYAVFPDLTRLATDERWRKDVKYARGGPLGSEAFGQFVDRFVCLDASTGKTLWKVEHPFTREGLPDEKSGRGVTPCVVDGVLVGRGVRGVYGLDAATGKQLWFKAESGLGSTIGNSHEESVVAIGGVAVLGIAADYSSTLAGLDPKTGAELWRQGRTRGDNAIPSQVILEGKPYILAATSFPGKIKPAKGQAAPTRSDFQRMVLIEPRSGKILWEDRSVGECPNSLLVQGDLVMVQADKDADSNGKAAERAGRAGVYRVTLGGATRLNVSQATNIMPGRNSLAGLGGVAFVDSRSTGFQALDLASGKIIARHPHLHVLAVGDHNWTWTAVSDGRVITSGLLQFHAADLVQLPGQLSVHQASGYVCPIKPAIADGRLFLRTSRHLVCYDLRASPERTSKPIRIGLQGVCIGLPQVAVPLRLRERGGRILAHAEIYPPTDLQAGLPYGKQRRGARWLPQPLPGLKSEGTGVSGRFDLNLGTDWSPIELDLKLVGGKPSGTWKRRVAALPKPIGLQGALGGFGPMPRQIHTAWLPDRPWTPMGANPPGTSTWKIELNGAIGEGRQVSVYLDHDGKQVTRAAAMGFTWNVAWHEVDARDLRIADGAVSGSLTLILHSDTWRAPVAGSDQAQVAMRVTLDGKAADGKLVGTWKGETGVAYETSGTIGAPTEAAASASSGEGAIEEEPEQ
jgi:outer membrane protein assembly factor BamB